MSGKDNDDELAYGDYNTESGSGSGERSFMGSFYRKFTGKQENERPDGQQAVCTRLWNNLSSQIRSTHHITQG